MRRLKLLFLFICRSAGLFDVARYVTRKNLKILCYHGFEINDETNFRPKLFISREKFKQRIKTLEDYGYQVLTLDEAITALYDKSLPDNSAVITIDDGFFSVAKLAAPILSQHKLPATVYATTYYVENNNPIYRLTIQYMFWKTKKEGLVSSKTPWGAVENCDLSTSEARDRIAWKYINYGETQCSENQRVEICDRLGKELGVSYDEIVRSGILRLMTLDELRHLENDNIDIELHTHRHVFPSDSRDDALREINDNRRVLKNVVRRELKHFCYPSGYWKQQQWEWLEAMGVTSATTCLPGLNSRSTPRLALRRFLDGENIHQLEFEANLSGFSDIIRSSMARLRFT